MKIKRDRLWLEITAALLIKATVISVIWITWFSDPEKIDGERVARTIFSGKP